MKESCTFIEEEFIKSKPWRNYVQVVADGPGGRRRPPAPGNGLVSDAAMSQQPNFAVRRRISLSHVTIMLRQSLILHTI